MKIVAYSYWRLKRVNILLGDPKYLIKILDIIEYGIEDIDLFNRMENSLTQLRDSEIYEAIQL